MDEDFSWEAEFKEFVNSGIEGVTFGNSYDQLQFTFLNTWFIIFYWAKKIVEMQIAI